MKKNLQGCESGQNYDKKYMQFYNSSRWKKLRDMKFADANGICEWCKKKGQVKVGIDVHHIKPIETDWDKRYDYNNLVLLCKDCHNEAHDRISSLQRFLNDFKDI